jgi:hypothetical protein
LGSPSAPILCGNGLGMRCSASYIDVTSQTIERKYVSFRILVIKICKPVIFFERLL